jgi:hypothetical protein
VAKYYFLQGVNLVVIAGPSLEMMVCKCRKTVPFSIWRLSVWEGRVSPVMFFVFCALWVPPHNANIVLPKTSNLFLGEGGHSNKLNNGAV